MQMGSNSDSERKMQKTDARGLDKYIIEHYIRIPDQQQQHQQQEAEQTLQSLISNPCPTSPSPPPRRRMSSSTTLLPVVNPNYPVNRRSARRPFTHTLSRLHAIPLLMLFAFFILWCFSSPVNLSIKDGRISKVHPTEMPTEMPLVRNDTTFDFDFDSGHLTILAVATSPNPSFQLAPIVINNTGEAYLVAVSGSN